MINDPLFDGVIKVLSDEAAEKSILGSLITYKDLYYEYSDQLFEDLFTKDVNKLIFRAIKTTADNKSEIDLVTVTNTGRNLKLFELKGGTAFISEVTQSTNFAHSRHHFSNHLTILTTVYQRRMLHSLGGDIQKRCLEIEHPNDIMTLINSTIVDITQINEEEFSVSETIQDVLTEMQDKDSGNVIPTGIHKVDEFIYGFKFGDFIVIGGAPSMGKTAFALRLLRNFVDTSPESYPTYFSLEMSKNELVNRIIAMDSEISLSDIRKKNLMSSHWKMISHHASILMEKKFIIDDKSGSLTQLLNKMRKYNIKYGTKIFIIDYLQLVKCSLGKNSTREQEVATISRSLKEFCREHDSIIIALSQLSREVSKRNSTRPKLSDLRESGSIEQDADFVLFPYRPLYYKTHETRLPFTEDAVLIIAKGRGTGTETIEIKFISTYTKYLNGQKSETSQDSELDF